MKTAETFAAISQLAQEIWGREPALRQRFPDPAVFGYWHWLLAEGTAKYPELLEWVPVPPAELRRRVHEVDEATFVKSGLDDAENFFRELGQAGFDIARGGRLLDFGCGSGRILRAAARFADVCELHGVDIDDDAIRWCAANLGFASFRTIAPEPRTSFAAGTFDAVYAYSVFSHLPEELHRRWLEELHRITRPGAALVLTTMGDHVAGMFCRGEVPLHEVPTPAQMRADLPRLRSEGFLYYPLKQDLPYAISESKPAEEHYGMTFLTEEYVRRAWLDLFELVDFRPAPQEWQDSVILRRR